MTGLLSVFNVRLAKSKDILSYVELIFVVDAGRDDRIAGTGNVWSIWNGLISGQLLQRKLNLKEQLQLKDDLVFIFILYFTNFLYHTFRVDKNPKVVNTVSQDVNCKKR